MTLSCSYLPSEEALEIDFPMEETADYIYLKPKSQTTDTALFFIPGGLVDPHAYLKTFLPFAEKNNLGVIISKVRGNLAIMNTKQTDRVMNHFGQYSSFILAGHSLGGTVAALNTDCDRSRIAALIFMASYSTADLHDLDIPVAIFRGSEDGLVRPEDITDNVKNLPPMIQMNQINDIPNSKTAGQTVYYTISGGNHAQFGSYGQQKDDGTATITEENQQDEFYRALVTILQSNEFNL